MIGHCGLCGTPLQPLLPRPVPPADPGWWLHAEPGDGPGLAALRAHAAIVHDDASYLPPLLKRWPEKVRG